MAFRRLLNWLSYHRTKQLTPQQLEKLKALEKSHARKKVGTREVEVLPVDQGDFIVHSYSRVGKKPIYSKSGKLLKREPVWVKTRIFDKSGKLKHRDTRWTSRNYKTK